jgi:hypothetical protein
VITDQQPKEQMLELHELEHDTATQSRVVLDPDTVEKYGELMRDGHKFPPIVVFYDGNRYWNADGWHRCGAAGWASKKSINCLIYQGTKEDAIVYSAGANARHGKAMSNADKRKCVETVLKIRGEWSDRAIADHVGCSEHTVKKVRDEVRTVRTSDSEPSLAEQFEKRIGRDGKSYPTSQPVKEHPVDRADRLAGEAVADIKAGEDDDDPMIDLIAEPYRRWQSQLSKMVAEIREEAEDPLRPYLADTVTRITTDLQTARTAIRNVEPAEACSACGGETCGQCRNCGYHSRAVVNQRVED